MALLNAQINKTDRNDARDTAADDAGRALSRGERYRSQELRMLLTHRKLLQAKAIAIENDVRATLRSASRLGWLGR